MKLSEILQGLGMDARVEGDPCVEILDLAYDSRKVIPGALFFALPGLHVDGAAFIDDALDRGARAVMSLPGIRKAGKGVFVEVDDVRGAMARVSACFFGWPSRELKLIGVTGTNGKTTFTYLMESILRQAGLQPGVVGTVSYRYGDLSLRPKTTTPESVDLQRILREMVRAGCTHALVEVSSHGLDYRRVDCSDFLCAVFTMLGRDHLDHHRDMESYYSSKTRLFTEILDESSVEDRFAVLNRDDPYGRRLEDVCPVPVVAVSQQEQADFRIESASFGREGLSLKVGTPQGPMDLDSRLLGKVNAVNILLAVAVSRRLGLASEAVVRGVRVLERVPGRLEKVGRERDFLVLVDYAHTPDAMEKVLSSLRTLTPGRLITVFGCGGDRDRGKRPLMGAAAGRWSDLVVVTSDNPRSESPERIIEDIRQGIDAMGVVFRKPGKVARWGKSEKGEKQYTCLVDRREAIRLAVNRAGTDDTVLIAGKGHEDVQVIGDTSIPFRDDREVLHALGDGGNEESAFG